MLRTFGQGWLVMGRMRGTLRKAKTKKTGGGTSATQSRTRNKTTTKKMAKVAKPTRSARRSRRDDDEDEDDDRGGRFGPPPTQSNAGLVMIIVGVLAAVVLFGAMLGSSGGPSIVDEHEAEKVFMKVDGAYAQAKGGDALGEYRSQLREQFQRIADTYPGTESAEKALKRIQELK